MIFQIFKKEHCICFVQRMQLVLVLLISVHYLLFALLEPLARKFQAQRLHSVGSYWKYQESFFLGVRLQQLDSFRSISLPPCQICRSGPSSFYLALQYQQSPVAQARFFYLQKPGFQIFWRLKSFLVGLYTNTELRQQCVVRSSAGVNILHKWVKLFPDGHFHAHKLFPEMMRELRLYMGYFNIILSKV